MIQLLIAVSLLVGEGLAETCKDYYLQKYSDDNLALDGLYDFTANDDDPYLIYCDFETGYGYTYISTTAYQNTNTKDHHFDRSEFKIVLLYANGSQYQVPISRPEKSRKLDVSFTYESSYNSWLANDLMYPYITVSMKSKVKNNTIRGYLVNGTKVSDQVCDREYFKQYARLIFAFLFNHKNLDPVQDEKKRQGEEFLKKWVDLATLVPDETRLPRNFFSFFEVKHKDCGGYMTRDDYTDVIGAAIGLKFVIRCGSPPDINHASKHISGYEYNSTVTYECDDGFEFRENQTELKCSAKGKWLGRIISTPCIRKKPRTCLDHETMNNARIPGVYIVYDRLNQPYKIYCEFYDNYTLTFMTPFGMERHRFDVHHNDTSVVIVRSYLNDGRQVESEIRQLDSYKDIPIEFHYSSFLNVIIRIQMDAYGQKTLGYVVNGVEVKETYDYRGYENSKIAIEFKMLERKPSSGKESDNMDFILYEWLTEARNVQGELYMPKSFFFSFVVTSFLDGYYSRIGARESLFQKLYGINIGLRYNKY